MGTKNNKFTSAGTPDKLNVKIWKNVPIKLKNAPKPKNPLPSNALGMLEAKSSDAPIPTSESASNVRPMINKNVAIIKNVLLKINHSPCHCDKSHYYTTYKYKHCPEW